MTSITSLQQSGSLLAKTRFSHAKQFVNTHDLPFSYHRNLGVASVEEGYPFRLFIANRNLVAGERVLLVYAGFPQWFVETEIVKRLAEDNPLSPHDDKKEHVYQLNPLIFGLEDSTPLIAVARSKALLVEQDHWLNADLDGDGQAEYFRHCTSHEGVHLTVWTEKPLQGKPRWHYYYDLSFEVEPSCQEIETREP